MNQRPGISAVILAGGKKDDPLAVSQNVAHTSLIPIKGRPIIAHLVEAFSQADGIGEIIVVGRPEVLETLSDSVIKIEAADTAPKNVALAVKGVCNDWLVIAPSDMPLVTYKVVNDFIAAAIATGGDLVYPIVSKEAYEAKFPGGRRTYVRLKEGTFTGGNMVFARSKFMEAQLPLMQSLFDNRKNPLGLAALFGGGFLFKLLLHRLDLPAVEARASRITRGRSVALPIDRPEMAFDIDKIEVLESALRLG